MLASIPTAERTTSHSIFSSPFAVLTVTTQPLLGSLFRSQNTSAWTEDLFEDVKFKLYRAEFDISRTASLHLTNSDLGYEKLDVNPVETNAGSNTTATSTLFKNNNFVIKVNHQDNGFDENSYVFFRGANNVGGVNASQLNSRLFKISNVGVDYYNITSNSRASANSFGGGLSVMASHNRKFEKLYALIPNLSFSQTKIDSFVKTTNISPIDDNVNTFTSYSQSDYEKTFLNEEFFFVNQKVLASRINETINNINRSLTYKLDISSVVSYLSPIIDLSKSSLKTISNKVENAFGREDRFGRRNQMLQFYPVYTFLIDGIDTENGESVSAGQSITGQTTKASGSIVKVSGTTVWVKLKTTNAFTPNGVNPIFKPVLSDFEPSNYDLTIFDQWGQVIFKTSDPNVKVTANESKISNEIISEENKLNSTFFLLISFAGNGNPLNVVFKYRSPNPRTYTLLEPSCLETPDIFETAPAASLTPFFANSSAPILCLISTAFFWSNNNAVSLSLFVLVVITTSSKDAALAAKMTSISVALSAITSTSISCVS